jgi:hypothetical protein
MKRISLVLVSFFPAVTAFAHPGHGQPGFLHAHGDWAALGVVALLAALLAVLRK